VENDVLTTLLTTYGAPLVFIAWIWWHTKGGDKEDPGAKILDALADLRERVAKIEGYLEGDK
jgi:hypothetical protein